MLADSPKQKTPGVINHPSRMPGWRALELLCAAMYDGRPDGTYQGGYELGALKRVSGITSQELSLMLARGLVVQRAFRFGDPDPDRSWGIEITPSGESLIDFGHMQTFLSSIASARPQSEQAEWMVKTARQGLRFDSDGDVQP